MGDPKKTKKKFSRPKKLWEKERIEEEKELIKEYYFKNKSEIWKLTSELRNFKKQAKRIIALKTPQAEKEKIQLLTRIKSLGLIPEAAQIEEVLGITQKSIFDRRLQSIVFKKGFARSMKQARQFIIHGHILVDQKKVNSPNFLVPHLKENLVAFSKESSLSDPMHPERIQETKLAKKPAGEKKEAKKAEEKKPKKEAKKEESTKEEAKKEKAEAKKEEVKNP
jgi:small subunit ribosomal protein S4